MLSRRELLAGLGALGACRAAAPARPDILLVTLCSLRADRVGWQGYRTRATTPRLDALATRAAVFTRAWANATWTNASHASILSGRFPGHHHVADDLDVLVPGLPTLPGLLRDAGWRAAALVEESSPMSLPEAAQVTRDFEEVWRLEDLRDYDPAVVASWAAARPEPFFAMVHLREAHLPFGDGAPFLRPGDLHPAVRAWQAALPRPGSGVDPVWNEAADPQLWLTERLGDASVRASFDLAYDSGVHAADASVGRLLDALQATGRAEPVVVVLADHGEALVGHKDRLDRAVLHVPMLLRVPGLDTRTIDADVSQVDLLPTLAELLGLEAAADGASLLPLLRGEPAPARAAFTQAIYRDPERGTVVRREAITRGGLRLVQAGDADFEIEVEEGGQIRHLTERTPAADALHAELKALGRDSWTPPPEAPRPTEAQRKAMQQSGYF